MESRVIRCAACGKPNRVPPLGSGKRAVCGSCKASLDQPHGIATLTDATFAEATRAGAMVVDFWAAWCGPCRAIAPVLEQLAAERSDVAFAKLNVDENPRTAARFGVKSIPLLIFFREGRETGRVVGAVPRPQVEAAMQQYLR